MSATPSIRNAIWFLAIVAAFSVLKLAAPLFAPIVLALVLGVVLSPFAGRIDRLGAPPAMSALLTLLGGLCLVALLIFLLEPVLSGVMRRAPIIWDELREIVSSVQAALRGLDDVGDQVSEALNPPAEGDPAAAVSRGSESGEEDGGMRVPRISDALLYAPGVAAQLMIFIGTLYFFLLSRREVYDWISASNISAGTAEMLEAEREVSRYFLTITLINAGFGTTLAGALWLVGMPYAMLWGFMAFVANFILYLGPAVFAASILLGGIVAFEGPISFAPVAIYVGLNLMESQFVTPGLVGRQMAVSPLLVFLSLVFWLWMWGPVGGIIAIPLLVWGLALYKRSARYQSRQA